MDIFIKSLSTLQERWKLTVASPLVIGGAITLSECFALSCAGTVWAIAFSGDYAWGQVVNDNTLGAESSQVTFPTPGAFQIDGGATRATNLFHSFTQFSVPTNGSVRFNNRDDIQNIISRVTGTSVSNIDGWIKANGTANLFLINPNGIMFGPNAKLDIGGSFLASTADTLLFADGTQWSAKDTQTKPLLTVNVPIGLQWGGNPAPVRVQGSNLEAKPNQNLVLVGGEVSLDAGKLTAPGGRIELGGLSTAGIVQLNDNGSLSFPDHVTRSDVSITNDASVNVRAGGGGFITINARNLEVSGGSELLAGIEEKLGTLEAEAGAVKIKASDRVFFDGSNIENQVGKNAKGNAGNIEITTGSLFSANKALLSTETRGQGDAGDVMINASDTVSLNNSRVETEVEDTGEGKGGNIEITTNSLSLVNNALDNALLEANTEGKGDAGQVIIKASDRIFLDGSTIENKVEPTGIGNSGGIDITTGSLSLVNQAKVSASSYGHGNAGKVIIDASGSISINTLDEGSISIDSLDENEESNINSRVHGVGNSGGIYITADSLSLTNNAKINATVEEDGQGNSDGIYITVNSLSLTNGAKLNASIEGKELGNTGPITIHANDSIFLDGSTINNKVEQTATGDPGGIYITTGSLSLVNGAGISTSTHGRGNAGPVIIHASGSISLDLKESYINSRVAGEGVGNSGGIYITADSLSLTNNAKLDVTSFGQGNPGNLVIKVNSIQLDNQGKLTAETASGNGGNITLYVQDFLLLRHNSNISTTAGTAGAGGEGGKIKIDTGFIVAVPGENSDITANAFNGKGGTVIINATGIFGMVVRSREDLVSRLGTNDPRELDPKKLATNDITAISQTSPALNGVITVNAPDVDPSRGLANLPVEPANDTEVAQGCQGGGTQASVAFFNTGKGGIAPNPYEPLSSSEIWEDVPLPTQRTATSASTAPVSTSPATPPNKLVEAQGWLINEKGEVTLVAQMPATHTQGRCRLH
jgi:filamentous hemagglutinin family protein